MVVGVQVWLSRGGVLSSEEAGEMDGPADDYVAHADLLLRFSWPEVRVSGCDSVCA